MLLCCFCRPRVVDDEPNEEQPLKKRKWFKKEKKKKRGKKRGKLEEQIEMEVEVKQTNENGRKEVEEVAVEEVKAEKEKNEVEKQLLLKEVSIELVKELRIDLERGTGELKDEETSLKEEQVEEPVPADPLGIRDESSDDSASPSELAGIWIEDLLLNTVLANSLSKLEEKEATAISTHFKNSGDAQHQDYELLLIKLKRKWARIFSEMNAVSRPLVHPPTSSLHNDTPVDLHLHLNTTVDSTMKELLKQMDMKRKWMKRLREREELKNLTDSSDERPADVSHTEKSDLLLPTNPPINLSKLEDKEASAISSHLKNSGHAQYQDYELLLMKMKRKWAGIFSETSAVKRPLVHPPTSSLHNDTPVDLHLHLNTTVDSTLKEELKQMDMKRKWMKRLREREELKNLTDSSDERPADVSHTEKSACKTTAACKASEQAIQETLLWCKDLLLNTVLANSLSKLEEKEASAISTHFKNSGDAQHQDYELLLMKLKRKWARIFSEMNAVSRPLVHPPTSSLHNDAPVDLHLHLNTTVDSTLKEELKQMDMKRKWMKRLREREELKNLTDSSDERPADVSHTEKSDLLLNTVLANSLSKLEENEASAISTHFKNSGQAQYQDYELLLMKMKKKWARIFSETSAVKRPLVHPPTSSLHNDTPVDLHLHLNTKVDSTLKEELKQMDMKRKWMKRLREREELKNLTDSSDERPADVSHTEKSDLLLNTVLANSLSKLEEKEATAISTHFKNIGDAQHQDYELLLMKLKRKWARIFSEMNAVSRPLVHPPTSSLHNDTPVDLHLHLNTKVDSNLKEELKQMDMKRKWMKRLREREELKNLTDSSDERPADVSNTEKSDLLLPTNLPINLSKLEEKEASAISSHLKNSGQAQYQDYELLLMKMKKKWARIFSETSALKRPLVHPPTSSLHNDTPVDLHLHLNTTVDSTLKEELKQMDMKRKWMKRLREREELKILTDSSDERLADVSHTEKSVQSQPLHPPRTTPPNVHSPVKGHKQMSWKRHLNKTSTCSQEQVHAKKAQRKRSKNLT
ncbi:hypothetical protein SRHO_G00219090 [Serrasalmus rhombeus]